MANINKQTLREPHVKYGAFILSVTAIIQYNTKPPEYELKLSRPLRFICIINNPELIAYRSDNILCVATWRPVSAPMAPSLDR